ncbi:MAG: sulfurtransferase complex subunit TusC [Gammaproteobacteria bacterium]|nr:sulfurtransferase complex subunit TusC [Gammaproteobacteria bacterium]MBQ0838752.1 sulfurtransferase complex subunit TusC [Gammaproteobacteria bacterium]
MAKPSTDKPAQKEILLVFRHAPYGSALAREGLEAVLACGAMGAKTSVLYINEGVWQLLEAQNSAAIDCKNQAAMASALPLYDIDDIWVDEDSLRQRNLSGADINAGKIISRSRVQTLLASSNKSILSF